MDIIKAFAINRNFVNHAPGVVAEIGELSKQGFTYAKEPRVYSSQTYPTVSFAHFPTKNNGVGYFEPIPDEIRDHVLKMANTVYAKTLANPGSISTGQFVDWIQSQLGNTVDDIQVGAVKSGGNYTIVEWVEWTNKEINSDNINKLWFVNNSFLGQFDEYDIDIILPFYPPSSFFASPNDVKQLLKSRTYQQEIQAIDNARTDSSGNMTTETYLWGKEYNYVNPVNSNDKTPAKFSALLYGAAANNLDLIKGTIVDYLLQNSHQTVEQWKQILPELFLKTEFLLFPQWDNMAIEHILGGQNGIYSAISSPSTILDRVRADAFNYPMSHVNNNTEVFVFPYNSITVAAIGHLENRDDAAKLSELYPDYFFTPTTSADFNRMTLNTQNWVMEMSAMLPVARDLTTGSTMPGGYARVIRGRRLFLAKSIGETQFLVASPTIL